MAELYDRALVGPAYARPWQSPLRLLSWRRLGLQHEALGREARTETQDAMTRNGSRPSRAVLRPSAFAASLASGVASRYAAATVPVGLSAVRAGLSQSPPVGAVRALAERVHERALYRLDSLTPLLHASNSCSSWLLVADGDLTQPASAAARWHPLAFSAADPAGKSLTDLRTFDSARVVLRVPVRGARAPGGSEGPPLTRTDDLASAAVCSGVVGSEPSNGAPAIGALRARLTGIAPIVHSTR